MIGMLKLNTAGIYCVLHCKHGICLSASSVSAGQLLCSGLFSSDGLSTWFAAVALLHAMIDNSTQKEQLLRVQLATSLGHPPVSLLQQCTNILTQVTLLSLPSSVLYYGTMPTSTVWLSGISGWSQRVNFYALFEQTQNEIFNVLH